MGSKTLKWDSAAALPSDAETAAYIEAALEEGDTSFVGHALGVVARAKGMAQIAKDSGLSRAHLYTALSREGNASFDTIMRVLRALKLEVRIRRGE